MLGIPDESRARAGEGAVERAGVRFAEAPVSRCSSTLGPCPTPPPHVALDLRRPTIAAERELVLATARRAKEAAVTLRQLTRAQKDVALRAMADGLRASTDQILAANAIDVRARGRRRDRAGDRRPAHAHRGPAVRHRRRPGARRRPARPGRRGRARLDPAQRPGDPPGARAHGRRGDGLRGPPERHRRRRRPEPQERQRGPAARVVVGLRLEHRPRRRHARGAGGHRRAGRRDPARARAQPRGRRWP